MFLSAIHVAISVDKKWYDSPASPNEIKASTQEQVEYILVENNDAPLLVVDGNVKYEVKRHISELVVIFENKLASLLSDTEDVLQDHENHILKLLVDFLWLCHVFPMMDILIK